MKLNEISAKYAQPQDLTNLRKKITNRREKPKINSRTRFGETPNLGQIREGFEG